MLTIENPFGFPIVVHGVAVLPGDASGRCDSNNLSSPGLTRSVKIRAGNETTVTVPITLRRRSPATCRGPTFPLTFSGRATQP